MIAWYFKMTVILGGAIEDWLHQSIPYQVSGGFKSQKRGLGFGGVGAGVEQLLFNMSHRKSSLRKFAQFVTHTASNFCAWKDHVMRNSTGRDVSLKMLQFSCLVTWRVADISPEMPSPTPEEEYGNSHLCTEIMRYSNSSEILICLWQKMVCFYRVHL